MKGILTFLLVVAWIGAAPSGAAQCGGSGGCSDPNCACCDCNGDCLFDSTSGCCGVSPIVIDVRKEGFLLTSAKEGVDFDFFGKGKKMRISWTAENSHNAWLVLDRNNNGTIDNGTEMFGDITPQPKSTDPNGFRALAVFDEPGNGGNDDGIIDAKDRIYSSLRLWIDSNHNGISEPNELFTLPELDVVSINLGYTKSNKVDEFGNRFRYKSTIVGSSHQIDRDIYDVLLVKWTSAPTTSTAASDLRTTSDALFSSQADQIRVNWSLKTFGIYPPVSIRRTRPLFCGLGHPWIAVEGKRGVN